MLIKIKLGQIWFSTQFCINYTYLVNRIEPTQAFALRKDHNNNIVERNHYLFLIDKFQYWDASYYKKEWHYRWDTSHVCDHDQLIIDCHECNRLEFIS